MKLKKWVIIMLIIMASIFILMLFKEKLIWNIVGLIGAGVCNYILVKYGKLDYYEKRGK